jgi:hypothetical protein
MFQTSLIIIELPVIYYENMQEVKDYSAVPEEAVQKKLFLIPINDLITIGEESDKTKRCYLTYADEVYEIGLSYDELKEEICNKLTNPKFNTG